ncbi:SET and MYND domain-containing protein 3, partial [Kappamyces sp. JEL0680]
RLALANSNSLAGLVSHREKYTAEEMFRVGEMITALATLVPSEWLLSPNIMTQLVCLLQSNSHAVCAEEGYAVGIGLFPRLACINHSCAPNCCISWTGKRATLYAVQDIAAGDQLFHSYNDPFESRTVRRAALLKDYYFECNCSLCIQPLDPLMAAFCTSCLAPTQSDLATDPAINQMLSCSSPPALLEALRTYSKSYANTHHLTIKAKRTALDRLLALQAWRECALVALELADTYQRLFGKYLYPVGILYLQAFKCMQHSEEKDILLQSSDVGARAIEVLKVTHPGSAIYRDHLREFGDWRRYLE